MAQSCSNAKIKNCKIGTGAFNLQNASTLRPGYPDG